MSHKRRFCHKVEAAIRFYGKVTFLYLLFVQLKSIIDIKMFFKSDLLKKGIAINKKNPQSSKDSVSGTRIGLDSL